jgi:hypothetical protein
MMPDRIKITHAQPMTTPDIRTALTSDDIPPGPLSEDDLRQRWNQQADEHNQWESLDSAEQLAWAQALAIKADRHASALKAEPGGESPRPRGDWFAVAMIAQDMRSRGLAEQVTGEELLKLANAAAQQAARAAPKAKPERPSETDLYNLAAEFNGDPVPAMRRALEVWGNPPQGAPVHGENPATPPGQVFPSHINQLAAIIRKVDGNNSMGAAALAEAILERYPLAFLVDQRLTSPACLVIDCLPEGLLDLLKSEPGRNKACTAVVSIEPLRDAPGPTFQDAIRLAEGCHDYSGGHCGAEGEAWHGAIDTVVDVLKRAAIKPWDSQIKAVHGVGAEAQAGEVALAVPVAECPHCGYEGEMVPAPQTGEVEA